MQTTITMAHIYELRKKTASLTARALHQSCATWQQRERSCLLVVLIHIAEIAKRNLHLDLGIMHLGDYCQQHLGLSEGEGWTRVHVAKASIAHPELLLALGSGSISLAVAALLARHLTTENRGDLLQRCAGKSKRWVEAMLAASGKVVPQQRSSLRPLLVAASPGPASSRTAEASSAQSTAAVQAPAPHTAQFCGAGIDNQLALKMESTPTEERDTPWQLVHQMRCTISDETKAKLLRLAEVLGIVDPMNKLDLLVTKATEIALEAKDPALSILKRRLKSKDQAASQSTQQSTQNRSRAIPPPVKRQVLTRARFQCEYESADGRRCCQRTGLEIDHRFPFVWGGEHVSQNLQVLCKSHHQRKTDEQQGHWVSRKNA